MDELAYQLILKSEEINKAPTNNVKSEQGQD